MKKIELLAPAGSRLALSAAVQSGADAVYLGGPMFSARQGADNFSMEEMEQWVRYCRLYGVKTYAAVNTLIKEQELPLLAQYAAQLNRIGMDGVILQDMGAVEIFRQVAPDLSLHASTQMTVTSLEQVRFLEARGFSRVVLARELSQEQIAYIGRYAKAELEVFVHGALCMCYSGQCLMSSMIGGRSGNRGRCAQPCRLPYELEGKKGHFLSPKDLCLIDDLTELKRTGVASLKIEGRLKRPEYVSAVTGIYRKYLDRGGRVSQEDRKELEQAFNRGGFTRAYFAGETGRQMMCYENPGNQGGNAFSKEARARAVEEANFRKIPVSIHGIAEIGKSFFVRVTDEEGRKAEAFGEILAEFAQKKPLEEARLISQLSKLGATPFSAEHVTAETDGICTLPVSELNKVRREALDRLAELRCAPVKRREGTWEREAYKKEQSGPIELTVQVHTAEQAKAAVQHGIRRIYAPLEMIRSMEWPPETEPVAVQPPIRRDRKQARTWDGAVLVSSFGGKEEKQYGGFRLNVFNSVAADFYRDMACVTLSPELNKKEVGETAAHTRANIELIGYGRLPLMVMENCPLKAAGACQKKQQKNALKDRMRQEFPLLCGEDCTLTLFNAKPLFLADRWEDVNKLKINSLRLVFTVENFLQCGTIIEMYQKAQRGEAVPGLPENSFTRGQLYRGVL